MKRSFILAILLVLIITPFAYGLTDTKEVAIKIDLTAPVITITGVEEGAYPSSVTPLVDVKDNNEGVEIKTALSRYGEIISWQSGQEISEYGSYKLSVLATDKAGNKAEENVAFTLETWTGETTITINKDKYVTGETMTITVMDLNKTGQGSVKVDTVGLKNVSEISLTETSPGIFTGKYVFSEATMSGAFELKYNSIAVKGSYEVSKPNTTGGSSGKEEPKEEKPEEKPIAKEEAPGTIIEKVTTNEAKASGDTAVFRVDANGNYIYVPTVYDPNTGKHIILNKEEGEELLLIQLTSQSNKEWAAPARDWLEQRRLISDESSDYITKNEIAGLLESTTGTEGVLNVDASPATVAEMNQMINQVLDISPLGKYVDRTEIEKWAKDRQAVNKPVTRQEVLVTTYWFLQNVK